MNNLRYPFLLIFLGLFVGVGISFSQTTEAKFQVGAKLKTRTFGKGFVSDGARIVICSSAPSNILFYAFETYQIYNFNDDNWESVDFPIKILGKSARDLPSSIAEFLPGKNVMITMGDPIEFLDFNNFRLSAIKIEGGFPWSCGSAVWKDKIYFFGGAWASNKSKEFVYNSAIPSRTLNTSRDIKYIPTHPPTIREVIPRDLEVTDQLFVFDSLKFTELSSMPDNRNILGKFVGDKLYALGGSYENEEYNDIFKYDPLTDEWNIHGHLPHNIAQNSLATDGTYIYVTGMNDDKGYLGIYDPIGNNYREYVTNLDFINGALIVHEKKLYFFAGRYSDERKEVENRLYILDMTTLPDSPWISCRDN